MKKSDEEPDWPLAEAIAVWLDANRGEPQSQTGGETAAPGDDSARDVPRR
jgi:hypothetical protein